MANDTTFTIPARAKKNGFTPVNTQAAEACGIRESGIKDTVVIKTGDLLILDSAGGALLGGDGTILEKTVLGIAVAPAGVVTGSANASLKVLYYPYESHLEYYVVVGTGTIAAADMIVIADFDNEYSIDVDDGAAANTIGFKPNAFDATNGYARGYFRLRVV